MQILQLKNTVAFMSYRKAALLLSLVLMLASVFTLATNKLNFGLDFTGGTLIEIGFDKTADLNKIREIMDTNGFDDAVVKFYGSLICVVLSLLAPVLVMS